MWTIKIRARKAGQSFLSGECVPRLRFSLLITAPQEPGTGAKGCAGAGIASAGISLPQQRKKREYKLKIPWAAGQGITAGGKSSLDSKPSSKVLGVFHPKNREENASLEV